MSETISDRQRIEEMEQFGLVHAIEDWISGDSFVREGKIIEDVQWLLDFALKATAPPVDQDDVDMPTIEPDAVQHPSHYNQGRFETIEVIEEFTKGYNDGFVAHCVGTATKYISRAPYKHESPAEDLRKAAKYLEFAIEHLAEKDA